MPAVDEASHAALASTLTTPADRRHQDLLDQPEARSASFARDTGGSDDLLSITDSDSLDLDKFDFTPFLCDRQNPADTLGRLATAEEIFSFLTGPSPAAQPIPRGSPATTGTSVTTDQTRAQGVAERHSTDDAGGEDFAAQKRDLSARVDRWFNEFEDMCIRSKRMEGELELLLALASERVAQAAGAMLTCIEQCEYAQNAGLNERRRLARARNVAGDALDGCVQDLLSLREDLNLVQTAPRTFPAGAGRLIMPTITTRAHLTRYFEVLDVPSPAVLMVHERTGDN